MVKLYSDTRIRIASSILHLISNSRIFRDQVLTRKSRDSKKIWAIWMQTGGRTCGHHGSCLTPGFALLAPKKSENHLKMLPVLLQPFFFQVPFTYICEMMSNHFLCCQSAIVSLRYLSNKTSLFTAFTSICCTVNLVLLICL